MGWLLVIAINGPPIWKQPVPSTAGSTSDMVFGCWERFDQAIRHRFSRCCANLDNLNSTSPVVFGRSRTNGYRSHLDVRQCLQRLRLAFFCPARVNNGRPVDLNSKVCSTRTRQLDSVTVSACVFSHCTKVRSGGRSTPGRALR